MDPGDREELGRLFEEHRPALLALVARRLKPGLAPRVEAEDVVMRALEKAVLRWESFPAFRANAADPDRAAFLWLCQVVTDCLHDERAFHTTQGRDVRREQPLADDSARQAQQGLVSPATSPTQAAARHEREERLEQAMARLKPADQEILRRLYLRKQPLAEAARELGIREGTARTRHSRALRRLKNQWKTLFGSEELEP